MKFLGFSFSKGILYFLATLTLIQLFSCKPTRWLEGDEHLLKKNTIIIDNKSVSKKEMESYFRQKPNKSFLVIFKFRLATYNFTKFGVERKWKKWMRRVIGEEPAIYDSVLVERTNDQFIKYLKNEAYYDAKVNYEVTLKKKKAWVEYNIKTAKPVLINRVAYEIEDTNLQPIIFNDTIHSLLTIGNRMTVDALESERNRIVTQLRDSGFYEFNQNFIKYKIDTLHQLANVTLLLKKVLKQDSLFNITEHSHKQYWINKIYFLPDFDPQKAFRNRKQYFSTFDTTYYQGFGFIYTGEPNIKPKTILKANTINTGDIYNFTRVNSTTNYLNSLRLFRLNNINFYSEPNNDSLINCEVQLTPMVYQNYSINFETTTAQGNLGLGGYLNYQHKNLFKGAEILNLKVSGSLQHQTKTNETPAFNIVEYGAEAGLEIPSFILPFKMDRFYKKYNPKTSFSLSYNYQLRPDYTRYIYNGSMGYNWKGSETIHHYFSPIDISSVNIANADQEFLDLYSGTYLENNYKDYLILGQNYSLFYQNKTKKANRNFSYYRWNVGLAGNLLYLLHTSTNYKDTAGVGYYDIYDLQYAQFALTDIDYKFNYSISEYNTLVTRFFGGIAVPYGNATAIPFIKQYYGGGAQGIRAWLAKDLGPGTFSAPDSIYPNQTSDIKLEFNLEFRHSFSYGWNGALFIDVGNIWSISKNDERQGALFEFDKFYKQFAVGTGFGIRYDLDFAVFRFDWGIKVRDPDATLVGKESWTLFYDSFSYKEDMVWHFAVGYPF